MKKLLVLTLTVLALGAFASPTFADGQSQGDPNGGQGQGDPDGGDSSSDSNGADGHGEAGGHGVE